MSDLETQKKRLELACSCDPYGISTCLACDALRAIERLEEEPWNQDAITGLRWMLDPKTCTSTQEKKIAAKALNHIEELERERDAANALLRDERYIRELVDLWDRQASLGEQG